MSCPNFNINSYYPDSGSGTLVQGPVNASSYPPGFACDSNQTPYILTNTSDKTQQILYCVPNGTPTTQAIDAINAVFDAAQYNQYPITKQSNGQCLGTTTTTIFGPQTRIAVLTNYIF
jgi:hypothetical protein